MKLVYYQRPQFSLSSFGRSCNFQNDLDQLFESSVWAPALDVQEDKDNFTVRVELPGLKREDIDVSLADGALTITGERKFETVEEGTEVHRQERYFGKFSRSIALPTEVAADKITAQYRDGVLTVTLAKVEAVKPKSITVSE
jgi:HSP20 family protein